MDDRTFGLFITWTCYGTWLPGDKRGFVSNQRLPQGGFLRKINVPTVPPLKDDPFSRRQAQAIQSRSAVRLDDGKAHVAAETLVAACRQRAWRILRGAIMANHVHLVVVNCPDDGPAVRRVLKGVSQAGLSDAKKRNRRWWTAGGSNRYLHGHEAIDNAVNYVAEQAHVLVEIVDMVIGKPRRG